MQHFNDQMKLDEHLETSRKNVAVRTEMPEPGTFECLKNSQRAVQVSFVVFVSVSSNPKLNNKKPEGSYTDITYKHVPSGFGYYIHYFDETVFPDRWELYSMQRKGHDVAQVFVKKLDGGINRLNKIPRARPIVMTTQDDGNHIGLQ